MENTKLAAKAELEVHKRRSKKFYKTISDTITTSDDIVGIAFDYMSNLPLPALPVQEIFYLWQVWVNTFGVHNLKNNSSCMYVYHKG